MAPRRAGKGYVLGTDATQPFDSWVGKPAVSGTAEEIARGLDASARRRPCAGEGTKGPRSYDWADLELADRDADEFDPTPSGTRTRGLLIRRDSADGGCAYFGTWCHRRRRSPGGMSPKGDRGRDEPRHLGRGRGAALGHRGRVRDGQDRPRSRPANLRFDDHDETRSWHGWHRHVSLVMPAFAMPAPVALRRHHCVGSP